MIHGEEMSTDIVDLGIVVVSILLVVYIIIAYNNNDWR